MSRTKFDVFMCHNSKDRNEVRLIGRQLVAKGIKVWFDEWHSRPGIPWQSVLEEEIQRISAAAVFVGQNGIGPWQDQELNAFLREFARRGSPVIPVILARGCSSTLPVFLRGMTWVDFNERERDPLELLIWGITGKKPLCMEIENV